MLSSAPYSICPKGWRLPVRYTSDGSDPDFMALMVALGGSSSIAGYNSGTTPTGAEMFTKISSAPFNFLLTGDYENNGLSYGNRGAFYLSATKIDSAGGRSYGLYFEDTKVDVSSGIYNSTGNPTRCVKSS